MSQEVLDQEERRWAAMIANDLDALDELLHPQLRYTHSNALLDTKESYIASIANGVVDYRSVEVEDTEVCQIGDTAVVTGVARIGVHSRGADFALHCRYSSVWINDGGWRFFVWHNTPFPAS